MERGDVRVAGATSRLEAKPPPLETFPEGGDMMAYNVPLTLLIDDVQVPLFTAITSRGCRAVSIGDVGTHEVPLAFHADFAAVCEKLYSGLCVRNRDRGPGSSDAAPGHAPQVSPDRNGGGELPPRLREAVWHARPGGCDAQFDDLASIPEVLGRVAGRGLIQFAVGAGWVRCRFNPTPGARPHRFA